MAFVLAFVAAVFAFCAEAAALLEEVGEEEEVFLFARPPLKPSVNPPTAYALYKLCGAFVSNEPDAYALACPAILPCSNKALVCAAEKIMSPFLSVSI